MNQLRALIMIGTYVVLTPLAALFVFPWMWITGDIDTLYNVGIWIARTGVTLAGVRVAVEGMENVDPKTTYIFMSNHVSNLDPPVVIPRLGRRVSVLVKAELFKFPVAGYAFRKAQLVPVHRENRQAAIQSIHDAAAVLKSGMSIAIYPEGTRSRTGELLPFKKGPFYLAEEAGTPIIPITILNTEKLMPKGEFAIRSGEARFIIHPAIRPQDHPTRESLMEAVRAAIESGRMQN